MNARHDARQQGLQQGAQKGRLQGEALLLQRMLTRRFAPLPLTSALLLNVMRSPYRL